MKRRDLIKRFKNKGWWLLRSSGGHDIYTDGIHVEPIPRHSEIKENLARSIIRRWGL